ncbi:MAG: TIGR03752 family integrating conjugative element protein, partial [Sedimenticolaceae bacterium]
MMTNLPTAASPDVDTPADTVRSLSAQVAEMTEQTRRLSDENQKLREQNAVALDQEKRVAAKVRAELSQDIDKAGRRDEHTLAALSQQLEKLRGRLANAQPVSPAPAPDDMPVGFGYDGNGLAGAIHWIDGLDAPAAGPAGEGSAFAAVTTGSLLHPNTPGVKPGSDPNLVAAGARTPTKAEVKPVYTIPANATLTQSTAFSALIWRVPVGGQVQDPMPFKVLIGAENLAANGHQIPGLEGMVMSGIAVGDWTLSCVRGSILSATFIFEDGHVQTFGEKQRNQGQGQGNDREQESLGW